MGQDERGEGAWRGGYERGEVDRRREMWLGEGRSG